MNLPRFEQPVPTSVKNFDRTLPSLWQGGRAAFHLVYCQSKKKMLKFVSVKSSYFIVVVTKTDVVHFKNFSA